MKCKFCQQEFRPFENRQVVTFKDFTKSLQEIYAIEISTCSLCFKVCLDKEARKIHERRNHRTYNCHECNITFSSKGKLQYHFNLVHQVDKKKNISSKQNLKTSKTYNCSECGLKFYHQHNLYRHEREAHLLIDFNVNYVKKDSLTYKCDQCDKTFLRRSALKRHSDTVHSAEKKYDCQICAKKFPRKDNLARHRRNKHGEQ